MAKPNSIGFATPLAMDPDNQRVLMANTSLGTKFWLDPPLGPNGTIISLPETWAALSVDEMSRERSLGQDKYLFKADGHAISSSNWRSPALSPSEAIRLHIEVVDVRYERLSDMTDESLLKEGICRNADTAGGTTYTAPSIRDEFATPAAAYLAFWRQSYGPQSITRDPWVWVTEFQVSVDTAPAELLAIPVESQSINSIASS